MSGDTIRPLGRRDGPLGRCSKYRVLDFKYQELNLTGIPGKLLAMERWPMTGRIEEQAYLKSAIADPLQAGVLVAGGAGVGKTRLLREVIEGQSDDRIEFVTATESARPLPFGAFAHLLPEDLGAIDRVDMLAVIGRHLVHRAEGKSFILAVDDMHLLDAFSAAPGQSGRKLHSQCRGRGFESHHLHQPNGVYPKGGPLL